MTLEFYYIAGSPPCCLVSLVFAELGIDSKVNSHVLDMLADEQLKPDFLKLNPQHITPTIIDDGFILWESRAIAKYLASKYGSKLYPVDLKTRAMVDQRLDFDLGTLYTRFAEYYYEPYFTGVPAKKKTIDSFKEALGFLNTFLTDTEYAAGEDLTLADYALAVTVSMIQAAHVSIADYPSIVRWYALAKSTIPKFEEINGKYVRDFVEVVQIYDKRLSGQ